MIAFDTNVLIYAYDQVDLRRKEVATRLLTNTPDGVLLWQVACEFISASRKLAQQGLSVQQAWEYLSRHLRAFPIILPSRAVLDLARDLQLESQVSFWMR